MAIETGRFITDNARRQLRSKVVWHANLPSDHSIKIIDLTQNSDEISNVECKTHSSPKIYQLII